MSHYLVDLIEAYELSRELDGGYTYNLGYAVNRLGRYLGRRANVDDLAYDVINKWLKYEQELNEIGDRSRKNVRASIVTIWRHSGRELDPRKLRSVKVIQKPPEAWDFDEMRAVANAAMSLSGTIKNGLPRAEYFWTLLWFTFETGLRRGDVWRFDVTRFDKFNRASINQHKTGEVHTVQATDATISQMRRMSQQLRENGDQQWRSPLRWPQNNTTFYDAIKRCREIADVEAELKSKALQQVRRTGATAVECVEPGAGSKYLGHKSGPSLARKYYLDPRKIGQVFMPPVIRHHENRSFKERDHRRTKAFD